MGQRRTYTETFDIVATHLLKQGRRAEKIQASGKPTCCYRAPDGCKCAAGCLIPDEDYQESMEGRSAGYTNGHDRGHEVNAALVKNGHDPTFVAALQHIHDAVPVDEWAAALLTLARVFGLYQTCLHKLAPGLEPICFQKHVPTLSS